MASRSSLAWTVLVAKPSSRLAHQRMTSTTCSSVREWRAPAPMSMVRSLEDQHQPVVGSLAFLEAPVVEQEPQGVTMALGMGF